MAAAPETVKLERDCMLVEVVIADDTRLREVEGLFASSGSQENVDWYWLIDLDGRGERSAWRIWVKPPARRVRSVGAAATDHVQHTGNWFHLNI